MQLNFSLISERSKAIYVYTGFYTYHEQYF